MSPIGAEAKAKLAAARTAAELVGGQYCPSRIRELLQDSIKRAGATNWPTWEEDFRRLTSRALKEKRDGDVVSFGANLAWGSYYSTHESGGPVVCLSIAMPGSPRFGIYVPVRDALLWLGEPGWDVS